MSNPRGQSATPGHPPATVGRSVWYELDPAASSHVAGYGYNGAQRQLSVRYRNGDVYRWSDVPSSVWNGLRRSHSAGRYLHKSVYGRFTSEKLT